MFLLIYIFRYDYCQNKHLLEKIACKDKDFLAKLCYISEKNVIFAPNLDFKNRKL